MEDEVTNKLVSFRVSCKKITSLQLSLQKKPFFIKFSASDIQYLSGGPKSSSSSSRSKSKLSDSTESILLHLGYPEHVPDEIQMDLKELFDVRLADLQLWPHEESM